MNVMQIGDAEAAAVQKTPNRVTLAAMEAKVRSCEYLNPDLAPQLTIAVVILENGFSLVGKSAPADAGNFDAALGRKFAYEDAIRQMWALEGYLLRERLHVSKDQVLPEPTADVTGLDDDTTSATSPDRTAFILSGMAQTATALHQLSARMSQIERQLEVEASSRDEMALEALADETSNADIQHRCRRHLHRRGKAVPATSDEAAAMMRALRFADEQV